MSISPELLSDLYDALLECGPFDSNQSLRTEFVDARIAAWRKRLPEAGNLDGRIRVCVNYLQNKYNDQGKNALALFVRVVAERTPATDACRQCLLDLADVLDRELRDVPLDTVPDYETVFAPPPQKPTVTIDTIGEIKAKYVSVGGDIHISPAQRTSNKRLLLGGVLGIVLVVAVGALVAVLWLNQPMDDDAFNVVVARFTILDQVTSRKESLNFSQGLFEAIQKEIQQFDVAFPAKLRGPRRVGEIRGTDRETRAQNAAKVAEKYNVSLLIYGVVSQAAEGILVQPEFYVREQGFGYGCEVAGPDLLGLPITLTSTDLAGQYELNSKLYARTQVLRYLVKGLAYFFVREYDKAAIEFERATWVENWEPNEGQEVAYLLQGTAKLRLYDHINYPAPLPEAEQAFQRAHELNPNYSRSYLGLGAVAYAQAAKLNSRGSAVDEVDAAKLAEAIFWYESGLTATDQPATAYVPLKAAYGLGQVHLLGFEFGVPGYSALEAERYFEEVIAAYEKEKIPELAIYAAHAHARQGRIAGHKLDYVTMAREGRRAIDMLHTLPGTSDYRWIARYWAWVALAEKLEGNLDVARTAYRDAITAGEKAHLTHELEAWQEALADLEKGGE
ncbi:MAG: hypothetical protein JXA21_29505 [Anaerolineae bacterium]|nr:hypothetical protein [Anaerolineae bacterium]